LPERQRKSFPSPEREKRRGEKKSGKKVLRSTHFLGGERAPKGKKEPSISQNRREEEEKKKKNRLFLSC